MASLNPKHGDGASTYLIIYLSTKVLPVCILYFYQSHLGLLGPFYSECRCHDIILRLDTQTLKYHLNEVTVNVVLCKSMVLNNIYVKNVSANAGKDWAGDGEAVRQPQHINTSADNYANCANWHYGSWATSQNCVAEMFAVL